MKYILAILISVFTMSTAWATCGTFDYSTCPTKNCPQGTFMGDDGNCYPCDTEAHVLILCLGHEKVHQLCPNRFSELGCGAISGLTCFGWSKEEMKERTPKQYSSIAKYLNPFLKFWELVDPRIHTTVRKRGELVDYSDHTCINMNIQD